MSSKRAIRRKSCEGKIQYDSIKSAFKVLRVVHKNEKNMRIYKCKFCHQYHLGHYCLKIF